MKRHGAGHRGRAATRDPGTQVEFAIARLTARGERGAARGARQSAPQQLEYTAKQPGPRVEFASVDANEAGPSWSGTRRPAST